MNDKILWDIIDGLRDEVNIAQDGIADLNDVVKDLQAEAIEQIEDNKRLRKENAVAVADERVIEELQAEVRELQAENIKLSSECWCGGNNDVKAELNALREQELDLIRDKDDLKADKMKHILAYDTLQAEYNSLKAEFKDYSKRAREHHECGEEYERELKAEIKELKAKLNELQDERNTLKYALENKECGCGNQ